MDGGCWAPLRAAEAFHDQKGWDQLPPSLLELEGLCRTGLCAGCGAEVAVSHSLGMDPAAVCSSRG